MQQRVANVAAEWTPHTHTDTVSAGVRLKAKPRSCFWCTFFPLCLVCLEVVGGGYKAERETGRVWKLPWLVKSMAGAHSGSSPFIFSVAMHMSSGREMEGGKPESMLETCSCTRPSLLPLRWQHRECLVEGGCGDNTTDVLFTNLSQEEIIQLVRHWIRIASTLYLNIFNNFLTTSLLLIAFIKDFLWNHASQYMCIKFEGNQPHTLQYFSKEDLIIVQTALASVFFQSLYWGPLVGNCGTDAPMSLFTVLIRATPGANYTSTCFFYSEITWRNMERTHSLCMNHKLITFFQRGHCVNHYRSGLLTFKAAEDCVMFRFHAYELVNKDKDPTTSSWATLQRPKVQISLNKDS